MMRFTFPVKKKSHIFIRENSDYNVGKIRINHNNHEITGNNPVHRIYQGTGRSAGFSGYFVIKFDKPFQLIDQLLTNQQMVVGFKNEELVNVRIGTSFTSIEAARKNLDNEIPGLIKAMGGSQIFLARLNEFFDKGHYWHGNKTDQQAAYIFAMAGQPEKTQQWVSKIIGEEYGTDPDGLSGNEDTGLMSAWLVFSMMGFYPFCPASNEYIITTTAFDEVKILLPDGKFFIINSINRGKNNNYIKAITRNGARYNNWVFTHDDIIRGSRFTFQIDSKPPVR
jgi:putative alpha-1,2-mannosidase